MRRLLKPGNFTSHIQTFSPIHHQMEAIIETTDKCQLEQIKSAHIQAVIYKQSSLPEWFNELANAVQCEKFQVPRTILHGVSYEEIEQWIETSLHKDTVSPEVCSALQRDILYLLDWERYCTGASRFIFRALTGTPSRHCGFHVDTIPSGGVPWGLLRVYNGAGTNYIKPDNVTKIGDFYRYLSRRERLVRDWCNTKKLGKSDVSDDLLAKIVSLDEELAFVKQPKDIFTAAAGSIVAFKHLDISLHWSNHAKELAWIHCSPMQGVPRFLVNIAPFACR